LLREIGRMSYAQEIKALVETQGVAVNSALKTLHPFYTYLYVMKWVYHVGLPVRRVAIQYKLRGQAKPGDVVI